ncbi:MAG: TVP38/TMEM64 family protein, partial [Alphaproteobacteria bacterium]
ATIGAVAVFLAARTAFGETLRAKAGPGLRRMEEGFRRDAFSYLLVLRLVPLFPFWLVNLVPAFAGVRLGTYTLATIIGILPGSFVIASVGNGLGALLDQGKTPDLGIIFQWDILLPILGLALLALLPVALRRMNRRRQGVDRSEAPGAE